MLHPWLTKNGTEPIPNHIYIEKEPIKNLLELKLNFITPSLNGSSSSAREYNLNEISDIDDSSYSESD
jgi:hypothetical protein